MQPRCARKMTKATSNTWKALQRCGLFGHGDDGRQNLGASIFGDADDVLMFTVRSRGEPFVGKLNGGTLESQLPKLMYFAIPNGSIVSDWPEFANATLHALSPCALGGARTARAISHGHPISMIEMIFRLISKALSPPQFCSQHVGRSDEAREPFCSLPFRYFSVAPGFPFDGLPAPRLIPSTPDRASEHSNATLRPWILLVLARRDDDEYI